MNHEDNLEDWIEYVERSTREADQQLLTCGITNLAAAQKKLKWRQAPRIAR